MNEINKKLPSHWSKHFPVWVLVVPVVVALSACSSSQTEEGTDEFSEEDLPVADAGTDPVPQDAAEVPAAPQEEVAQESPPEEKKPEEVVVAEQPPAEPQAVAEAPAPEPAPVTPVEPAMAMTGEFMDYKVSRGDTLMRIAFEHFGDLMQWKKIWEDNRTIVKDPNRLAAGMKLKIAKSSSPVPVNREGEKYLVKHGDTLGTISEDVYGTNRKWKRIWEHNKAWVKNPNRIFAGFYVYYTLTPKDLEEKEKHQRNQLGKATPQAPSPVSQSTAPEAQPAPAGQPSGQIDASFGSAKPKTRMPASK